MREMRVPSVSLDDPVLRVTVVSTVVDMNLRARQDLQPQQA
jgi:hypothetical protein